MVPSVGSPDSRLVVFLRLPVERDPQWHYGRSLPAYSGGTVMASHHLPRR